VFAATAHVSRALFGIRVPERTPSQGERPFHRIEFRQDEGQEPDGQEGTHLELGFKIECGD
jgi:hypothetical protein